jgi:hypothetical protein
MFELKRIDADAIPAAMEKVNLYRALNEPEEAESICLDILAIEPDHAQARIMLLMSLTDQFHHCNADCFARAQQVLNEIADEYDRTYYAGLVCERRASALLDRGGAGSGASAYAWLHQAMEWYEKAEAIRPPGNDNSILRWNTCARIIMKHNLTPTVETYEPILQE